MNSILIYRCIEGIVHILSDRTFLAFVGGSTKSLCRFLRLFYSQIIGNVGSVRLSLGVGQEMIPVLV